MKSDHPGLKLSQYKERIFELWKLAPENPKNQIQHNRKGNFEKYEMDNDEDDDS